MDTNKSKRIFTNKLSSIQEDNENSQLFNSGKIEQTNDDLTPKMQSLKQKEDKNKIRTSVFNKENSNKENTNFNISAKITNDILKEDQYQPQSNFSKLPKYVSSTTTNKPLFDKESSIKGTHTKTPGIFSQSKSFLNYSSQFTTPNVIRDGGSFDSLMISNFPPKCLQKIINEFKNFGEIRNYNYTEETNVLVIQYDNGVSVLEANRNHNPLLVESKDKLIVVLANSNNFPRLSLLNEKDKKEISVNIPSPSVSYWN